MQGVCFFFSWKLVMRSVFKLGMMLEVNSRKNATEPNFREKVAYVPKFGEMRFLALVH